MISGVKESIKADKSTLKKKTTYLRIIKLFSFGQRVNVERDEEVVEKMVDENQIEGVQANTKDVI